MESLYQYAWLIPVLPLIGATLVGIGLISVNQTTNKLRQLNAVFIISVLGISTVLSFAILWSQIQGIPPIPKCLNGLVQGIFI